MSKNHRRTLFQQLQKQLPAGVLRLDPETLNAHKGDKWFAVGMPEAVAFPKSTEAVAWVMRFATQYGIPVTARGAGHGYVGGCVPVNGGIVLSLAKMNRIREVNTHDFVAVAQAGAITQTLQERVESKGLFYPPDPASRADSTIGGNIVTNAGGPRCLKYGVTRDYVLGLEVVSAEGKTWKLGSRTHKNKTGFDLSRLFVGSEGLLGIVTEATLKLLPLPPLRACVAVGFGSLPAAAQTIQKIFAAGFLPSALEIADAFTLTAARKRTGSKRLEGCEAMLIIELDGSKESVPGELRRLEKLIRTKNPRFLDRAIGAVECEKVWQIRREFSYALRDTGLTKLNEDVTVPRGKVEDLLNFAAKLERKYGLPIACFGHAGDGNIHVNVMLDQGDPSARAKSEKVLDSLFAQVQRFGGVITGEHGVGLAKKRWWPKAVSEEVHELHRRIKRALDPQGILNPGKFL